MKMEFIAEVSSNHNGDISRCIDFIETAKDIDCDGVKFQVFKIDKLFAPEILKKSREHRKRQKWELPLEFIPKLAQRSHELGLKFGCTPFYLEAVEFLRPYVDFYKIASYELLWDELLRECAKTDKPLVLSTGMAIITEIDKAMRVIKAANASKITLLHCVSEYPVITSQSNLKAIETLKQRYRCPVGWSDHSVSAGIIYRAVYKWRASMIEFHMDLDGKGEEFNIGHCWLPNQIKGIIDDIKSGLGKEKADKTADGDGRKMPAKNEMDERNWRTDASDGLRPLLKIRKTWAKS